MATKKSTKQKNAKQNIQPGKKPDSLVPDGQIKPSARASKASRTITTKLWKKPNDPRRAAKKDDRLKPMRPLGTLQVYQPVDPYKPQQRNLFRIIMKNVPQINRSNKLIQKLVVTEYTTNMMPRFEKEMELAKLEKWQNKKTPIPYVTSRKNTDLELPPGLKPSMSPNEVKNWMDRLFTKLDLQEATYNSYLFRREQGRCVIGMFPEKRDELGQYVIPEALRVIRPDYTLRPLINDKTGGLEAVEIIGLNSGPLDARRAIYLVNQDNLDLFADYYGVSEIEPLCDIGETLLALYGQDLKQITLHTWWQPKIFKMTIPARDADKPNQVMDEFLVNMRDAGGKDIVLTQTVELVSGTGTTNSGDVSGVVQIEGVAVDTVTGFYNIPPFLLSRSKNGTLGGNADREALDAFLNIEIRPEQIELENAIESMAYDRVLAILFNVEPNQVDDETVPMKLEHHFKKPDISAAVNLEQYEIIKDMAANGWLDTEKAMEKLNLTDIMKKNVTRGADESPSIKTWNKTKNPSWNVQHEKSTPFKPTKYKMNVPQRIEVKGPGNEE